MPVCDMDYRIGSVYKGVWKFRLFVLRFSSRIISRASSNISRPGDRPVVENDTPQTAPFSSAKDTRSATNTGSTGEIDRLVAMCDEISALVKNDLPLESSLLSRSRTRDSRIGEHLRELAEQVGMGKSLAEAVENDPAFPPVYAAVIKSGIESGRLSDALDTISETVRQIRDTRLFLMRTSLYPLTLFTVLWSILSVLFFFLGPRLADFFTDLRKPFFLYDFVHWCQSHVDVFLAVAVSVPLLLWLGFFLWCRVTSKGRMLQSAGHLFLLGGVPWVGRSLVLMQKNVFARILAMLVNASVPLDEAIPLAAQACNDRYWSKESREALRSRIVEKKAAAYPKSPISPLIGWAVAIPDKDLLVEGLQRYAELARTRVELLTARIEAFLPGFVVLCFAILIAACYFATVVWPYISIMNLLTQPVAL